MESIFILLGILLAPPGAGARACAGCHAGQAADHARSRHAVAWTNEIFAAEYREHPKAWCVTCHAPEVAAAARIDPPASADRGVTCASCHRPRLPGATLRARWRRPGSIHATEVDPDFGGAADCGGCHQFNFPSLDDRGRLLAYTAEPMQNTAAEARGADCASCHGDHRFAGSHDPAMVRSALAIEVCANDNSVELRLTNRGAAHNVPTGGVNRYMTARLWRSSAPERLVERRLGRRFGRGAIAKRTVEDTTIAPGATAVLAARLDALGGDPGEPVNAEVRYIYKEGIERLIERRRVPQAAGSDVSCRPNASRRRAAGPRDRPRPGR